MALPIPKICWAAAMCQELYKMHFNYVVSFAPHNHLREADFIVSILSETQTLNKRHRAHKLQRWDWAHVCVPPKLTLFPISCLSWCSRHPVILLFLPFLYSWLGCVQFCQWRNRNILKRNNLFLLAVINPSHLEKSRWCRFPPLGGTCVPQTEENSGSIAGWALAFVQRTFKQIVSPQKSCLRNMLPFFHIFILLKYSWFTIYVAILRFKAKSNKERTL